MTGFSDNASSLLVVLVPAVVMALGEFQTLKITKNMQSASQNLSAGLILGSISSELQPIITGLVLTHEEGLMRLWCICAIFVGGVLALAVNFAVAGIEDNDITFCGDSESSLKDGEEGVHTAQEKEFRAVVGGDGGAAALRSVELTPLPLSAHASHKGYASILHDDDQGGDEGSGDGGDLSTALSKSKPTPSARRSPQMAASGGFDKAVLAPSSSLQQLATLDPSKVRGLVASLRERADNLGEASKDRAAFDFSVHALERDVHALLRAVSRTPEKWSEKERVRVCEHASELVEAVGVLDLALNGFIAGEKSGGGVGSPSSSASLSSNGSGKGEGKGEKEAVTDFGFSISVSSSSIASSLEDGQEQQQHWVLNDDVAWAISDVEAAVEHLHAHVERSTVDRVLSNVDATSSPPAGNNGALPTHHHHNHVSHSHLVVGSSSNSNSMLQTSASGSNLKGGGGAWGPRQWSPPRQGGGEVGGGGGGSGGGLRRRNTGLMARGHWSLLGSQARFRRDTAAEVAAAEAAAAAAVFFSIFQKGEADAAASHQGDAVDDHGSEEGSEDGDEKHSRLVLVFTVSVDAFTDGLLIGLCVATDTTTACIMALATTLEMGFLGLAYGSVLRSDVTQAHTLVAKLSATASAESESDQAALSLKEAELESGKTAQLTKVYMFVPPVVMVLAGLGGAHLGALLQESTLLYIVMLSFATGSLMFLVTQELLIEAREGIESSQDSNSVTVCLFAGLFLAFILSTLNN